MFETFKNLLIEELQLDEDAITMEAELKGDLGINSIEQYELAMMCEDKFGVEIDDEELGAFLFSLGCYSGEAITVVRRLKGGCIVVIKDGRYNIDNQLAEAILV